MTRSTDPAVLEEAIAWHLRLQSGDDGDWQDFVAWLEADPARSDAFDEVEAGHAALTAEVFPAPASELDEPAHPSRWRGWVILAGIAAVLLVAILSYPMMVSRPDRYTVSTAAGEQRTIALAEGGSAALNGGTSVVLDRNDPRFAELVEGEAAFTVTHDPDQPFTLVAGDNRVQDAGTVFNAVSTGGDFRLEVAEGSVVYDPKGRTITLNAGQTLQVTGKSAPVLGRAEAGAIGSWQRRRLSYTAAPLARVAADVSRTQGAKIGLAPSVAGLPFTGSIHVSDDPGVTASDLAASIGLSSRKTPDGWIIEPNTRASP